MAELLRTTYHQVTPTHGNEVGVWICEGSGVLIGPCVFIQSVCPGQSPLAVTVNWGQAGPPPKSFKKSEAISLMYGECGRIPPGLGYLHLFSIGATATRAFERETALSDWQFPVRMAGVVVILNQKSEDTLTYRVRSTFNPAIQSPNRTLEWVKAQSLPFVIAAMGYTPAHFSEEQFHRRYGLASHIPIVPGPALADGSDRRSDNTPGEPGPFLSIFGGRKLRFDPAYARQVLGDLNRVIEANK